MRVRVMDGGEVASSAIETFGVESGERPVLVKTGIGPLDAAIGGLAPGTGMVIGMDQGVGKSRTVLQGVVEAARLGWRWGLISLEDGEDVVGSRLLALESGVNPLKMRKGELTAEERKAVLAARDRLAADVGPCFVCCVGGEIADVEAAVRMLAEQGCHGVVADYAQKVRGHSEQRNVEVAQTYTRFQRACADAGVAAAMCSQLTGCVPGERPRAAQLRETRDLANEARVIVLGWRSEDDPNVTEYVLDKSVFGGAGTRWRARSSAVGLLDYEVDDEVF